MGREMKREDKGEKRGRKKQLFLVVPLESGKSETGRRKVMQVMLVCRKSCYERAMRDLWVA